MILKYLDPTKVYSRLSLAIKDLLKHKKYKRVILELQKSGKIEEIGFRVDEQCNLYLGINLNPELLLYSETSQESVELKLISEKLKKYTDFLTKEGILDCVRVEYDRVKTEEYYGYILQIKYNFVNYQTGKFTYDVSYFSTIITILVAICALLL
jgi:hypothetical protein